jgi:hypothetical protein
LRKVLVVLGVGVLSFPLLFVIWLLLAVRLPKMDALTMRMPMSVRSTVAASVLTNVPWGKKGSQGIDRVIALDSENADAWSRRCTNLWKDAGAAQLQACEKAVALQKTAPNLNNLGRAQEKMGDECAAEESFTQASSAASSGTDYTYVENMGRASLRCGKAYDARAGLETAINLESRNLRAPDQDEDDIADYKEDQLADREYLIVTFDRMHDSANAQTTCSVAHPDWKGCACSLDAKGKVACVEARK